MLVTPTQSNPNDTIEAADINTPVNQLAAVINGNIETANLADASVTSAKIVNSSVTAAKLDFGGTGTGVWWEEIGRNTLTVVGDTLTVAGLPARKYLRILIFAVNNGGTINANVTFNGDTSGNYASRASNNGGADSTATAQTSLGIFQATAANPLFIEAEVINTTAIEKLVIALMQESAAGSANPPGRLELYGKWANTAAQISSVTCTNTGAGDYAIGSEIVVLGHN